MTVQDVLVLLVGFTGFIAALCIVGYWAFMKWKRSEDRKAEQFRDHR